MTRSRALGVGVVVAAVLVFINAVQADFFSRASFEDGLYADAALDDVLAARRADVQTLGLVEAVAVLAAGGGAIAVVWPRRATAAMRREPQARDRAR